MPRTYPDDASWLERPTGLSSPTPRRRACSPRGSHAVKMFTNRSPFTRNFAMRKLPDETIEREALLGVGVCVAGGASARRLLLLCCVALPALWLCPKRLRSFLRRCLVHT